VISLITGETGTTHTNSENTTAKYRESTRSRNYRKQQHCALRTAHIVRKVLV